MSGFTKKRKLAELLRNSFSDSSQGTSDESENNVENDDSENESESDDVCNTVEGSKIKKPLVSSNPNLGEVAIHNRKRNGKLAQLAKKGVTQEEKVKPKPLKQTILNIKGIKVIFPGQPYPTQKKMMASIIEGLEGENNNLIESPTGTGKTLAMLCAVLAWRRSSPEFRGRKIYYTTRTHSQISGIMRELKKTVYWKDIKTTILGSRDATCINPKRPAAVKNGKVSVNSFCLTLRENYKKLKKVKASPKKKTKSVKPKTCPFYHGTKTGEMGASLCKSHPLMDIEDYKRVGKAHNVCPYYTMMNLHKEADLVLCPYNYIISRQIRRNCRIDLEKSVIIFDEGHNLEKACCDEASTSITSNQAQKIAHSCSKALDKLDEDNVEVPKELEKSFKLFEKIFGFLASLIIQQQKKQQIEEQMQQQFESRFQRKNPSAAIENSVVLQMLAKIGFASKHLSILQEKLQSIEQIMETFKKKYLNSDLIGKIGRTLCVLEQLYSHCEDEDDDEENDGNSFTFDFEQKLKDYQLFFSKGEDFGRPRSPTLEILCMNPAVIFQEIEEATTSITITSGTLTPLQSFSKELNSEFPKPISLDQTIPSDRYFIARVGTGPRGKSLNFTYDSRQEHEVKIDTGYALLEICKVYENGVILFAPSSSYLTQLVNCWEQYGVMDKIEKYKHVFNETDKKEKNLEAEYKEKCKNPGKGNRNGALLLAYFRGTMSEGVDFKDGNARAVVTIGIPYMPKNAPVACARETYYNKKDKWWEWYNTDAFRAFNQGIGRCVRHPGDWGAVIMIEERLASPNFGGTDYDKYFPKWIRDASQVYSSFGKMIDKSKQFVCRMTGKNEDGNDETSESEGESSSQEGDYESSSC